MKKLFITFSKKDSKKGRLTHSNLKKVIQHLGDKTWGDCDYFDTISLFENGKISGISYIKYDKLKKLKGDFYSSYENKNGEYIDVFKEDIDFFKNYKKVQKVSFKDILNEANK